MSKPDGLSQEAWDAAEKALDMLPSHGVQMRDHRIENIARAIMSAKDEEREACANIADRYIDPIDIAHHIRKRGDPK